MIPARLLLLLLTSALSTGCTVREPPTHFYALNSVAEVTPSPQPLAVKVGVGPLDFPRALKRPQVVTRENDNKINVADFQQWGGRLDDDFLRILGDDLVKLLNSSEIYTYPWERRLRPDYQVRISVSRFDGILGKQVTLRARWQLLSRATRGELMARQSEIVEPTYGHDYSAYVAAQSRALARFAAEIALAIRHFAEQNGDE